MINSGGGCKRNLLFALIFGFCCCISVATRGQNDFGVDNKGDSGIRIMFYNTENLFFPSNDTLTADEDYTPGGNHHWTYKLYKIKIDNIARCIGMAGESAPPGIIGLCEIENSIVLNDLVRSEWLKKWDYRFIHKESPDPRGIDVALLYNPGLFIPISYELIRADNGIRALKTREMLYVSGYLNNNIPVDVFVVHWPSRRGGQLESEHNRILVAGILREKIDSLFKTNPEANIIVMGDFNDNPEDKSIHRILEAGPPVDPVNSLSLVNLMWELAERNEGSYCLLRYFPEWSNLDQIIVSGSLYEGKNGIQIKDNRAYIFNEDWLRTGAAGQPLSTFKGYRYFGGFSDHFPVFINIVFK